MHWRTIAIAGLGLAALSAGAQVHRCKDAMGKTVYSDQPCAAGQAGQQIERPRSQAEIMQEREQAYEAELLKQDRRMTEQERTQAQQQRTVQLPAPVANQPAEGWQERKNRENAATSARSITKDRGRWDEKAETERAAIRREEARRAAAAAAAAEADSVSTITTCNGASCTDTLGKTYTRNGGFLNRSDGRVCTALGNQVKCN